MPDEALHRTMTSSGTTGQQVSRIYLDRETSALQSKVLSRIMGEFLGKQRLPMIILDTSAVIKNRAMFSARGAGILGFSMFARDKVFALDEHMELDLDGVRAFLEEHQGETIFLFGFTFIIWKHVVRAWRSGGEAGHPQRHPGSRRRLEEAGRRGGVPRGVQGPGGGGHRCGAGKQLLRHGRADRLHLHGVPPGPPPRQPVVGYRGAAGAGLPPL